MTRRIRTLLVLVVAAVLVNLPLVHSTWTDRQVERNGVDVQAVVTDHETVGGRHLVTFRLPATVDPDQRAWQVEVDGTTYDTAVDSGELDVRVLEDDPSSYTVDGEATSHVLLVVTLVVDLLLLVVALLMWRSGGRRRPQLRALAVEDVQRCPPGSALERIEGETFLVRGEVAEIEEDRVVIELGDRSVLVILDGHRNPVGYQQPAQVHARLI